MPTPQFVHTPLPLVILYLPATHIEHTPPFGPVNPALQVQTEALLPPDTEYEPTPQSVHETLPLVVLYLPATQPEHTPPSGPVNPALQVQEATAVLDTAELEFVGQFTQVEVEVAPTTTEYEPTPQSVHATLPLVVLYLPATHIEHIPPFGPVNPALQVQAAIAELDTAEFEFTGHAKHTDDVLAPTVAENVPSPQSVHASLPLVVLYLPATHVEQEPTSGPVLPALHPGTSHPFTDDVPLLEFVPTGHDKHTDDAVAANTVEYVPTPQFLQKVFLPPGEFISSILSVFLYLPARQAVHGPPSEPVYPKLHIQFVTTVLE